MAEDDNREEGELSEEGELPEEAPVETVPPGQEANKGSADIQNQPAGAVQPAQAAARSGQQQRHSPSKGKPDTQHREPHSQDRDRHKDHHGRGSSGRERPKEHDRYRAEREKAELAQELDRLTYDISFQELKMNFVVMCQDLRTAIKKLDKLLRRVKRKREDDVELYPACNTYSQRIYGALKHVIVICGTALGRMADMDVAKALMRTAVNYRHDVLSAAHKRELEQQIRNSKEFGFLFTDRDHSRSNSRGQQATSQAAAGPSRQQADPEQRQPLQRGLRRGQQQRQLETIYATKI
eukprot:GHRR01022652.1.p1 GENE.GHRR01022652.1~~GHRR01022652.1.p1  ORF type:complete len:295 (+),score=91.87 GHRR01022652.1:540-1424(+)